MSIPQSLSKKRESNIYQHGAHQFVIGVDEAGRGPLAGPVVVAAIAIPLDMEIEGITDSKAVKEEDREKIFDDLMTRPGIVFSIVERDNLDIDKMNILAATLDGMAEAAINVTNACLQSSWAPHSSSDGRPPLRAEKGSYSDEIPEKHKSKKGKVLIDGNKVPPSLQTWSSILDCEPVVKGDANVFSIAAASILAKVTRDRIMLAYHKKFPEYGFVQHKGYPTSSHQSACLKYGLCEIHRMTFKPIRIWLESCRLELPTGVVRDFMDLPTRNKNRKKEQTKRRAPQKPTSQMPPSLAAPPLSESGRPVRACRMKRAAPQSNDVNLGNAPKQRRKVRE
eukprot:Selendium_serpulae@DN5987_c0_g1_i1.p2